MPRSKLQQELKKRDNFELPEQEAALNLMRTNDQIQIRLSRLFRDHGLTSSQYNVLRIVRGAGEPLPILDIANRTITVVPGITGLVDRLEQAGLVRRERCERDRRVIYVAITTKGLDVLGEIDQPLLELHKTLMKHLSRTELKELNRLLDKVRERLVEER